jgi:hypothetical protein
VIVAKRKPGSEQHHGKEQPVTARCSQVDFTCQQLIPL